jgi:hypothetical protein
MPQNDSFCVWHRHARDHQQSAPNGCTACVCDAGGWLRGVRLDAGPGILRAEYLLTGPCQAQAASGPRSAVRCRRAARPLEPRARSWRCLISRAGAGPGLAVAAPGSSVVAPLGLGEPLGELIQGTGAD